MSDISELQRLLIEKRAIESKIRALKAPVYVRCGSVKIEKKNQDAGAWQVCAISDYEKTEYETREAYEARIGRFDKYGYHVNKKKVATIKATRWWPFIRKDTKKEAIESIKTIANDLHALAEKLEEEATDDFDVAELANLELYLNEEESK